MSELLIQGVRVLDPVREIDEVRDLLIREGVFAPEGETPSAHAQCIDARGLCAAPGLVDMHVHLRDPGFTHKEDILSGCAAAAAGGFTSVACMPNTNPACDNADVIKYILARASKASAKVWPVAAITKGLSGEEKTDLKEMQAAGAVGVTDDGRPVRNNRIMLETMRGAKKLGMCVISHAEDLDIVNGGIMHLGAVSENLGVPGIDRVSEDCNTAVMLALAESSGTRIHIAHVSTRGAVALIRDAKKRGTQVTCETGPHYFTLTHDKLLGRDANFRMNPPLREETDRQAILEGIADGTIDCIATDHAPHAPHEKADFTTAPNGVLGLETSLGLCLTHLVKPGIISLTRLIEMMTCNPANILGIPAGTLAPGAAADLVLFDPNESWTVHAENFASKSRNTCFEGVSLCGRVKYTILDGQISYQLMGN